MIKIKIENLNVWFGEKHVLKDINLEILKYKVTAIIGPSGCGKTTLIRSMNKMHALIPNARVAGNISMETTKSFSRLYNAEDTAAWSVPPSPKVTKSGSLA